MFVFPFFFYDTHYPYTVHQESYAGGFNAGTHERISTQLLFYYQSITIDVHDGGTQGEGSGGNGENETRRFEAVGAHAGNGLLLRM